MYVHVQSRVATETTLHTVLEAGMLKPCTCTCTCMNSNKGIFDHTGAVGATFAVGACWAAKLRDRDDYKNAVVGGVLAGSVFGFRSKYMYIYNVHVCVCNVQCTCTM